MLSAWVGAGFQDVPVCRLGREAISYAIELSPRRRWAVTPWR